MVALVAAIVAIASVPFVPTGVPVLLAAGVAVVAGFAGPRGFGSRKAVPDDDASAVEVRA